ncbi:unnamed protein product [Schistocephalus solidus]|uniref:BTB_2 domain-containing protein n=1 Tax=Schistocephalus solidus TaxID=70667 RepID=A0A183S7X0_SCHSO|nr:unnamed protein product [Schistocephalus solidus]
MFAMVAQDGAGTGGLPIHRLFKIHPGFSMDENVQKCQLVPEFHLQPELNVRENRIQAVTKFLDHFPLDDDKGIVHIPRPEFRFVVCENQGLYFLENCLCDEAR